MKVAVYVLSFFGALAAMVFVTAFMLLQLAPTAFYKFNERFKPIPDDAFWAIISLIILGGIIGTVMASLVIRKAL